MGWIRCFATTGAGCGADGQQRLLARRQGLQPGHGAGGRVGRGLGHLAEMGIETIDTEVDRADDVSRSFLIDRGFTVKGDAVVQCWLDADTRPPISPLHRVYFVAGSHDVFTTSIFPNEAAREILLSLIHI